MHELLSKPLGNTPRHILRHSSGAELEILTGRGGSLIGWRVPQAEQLVELLDGYSSEEDLQKRYHTSHCGARLVPFPNRLKDGQWTYQAQILQLDKNFPWENGHAIHGLVFDLPWQVDSTLLEGESAIVDISCQYKDIHSGYPFPFVAHTRFILEVQAFTVETRLQNLSQQNMPFGEGWHPYFRVGCPIDQAELQVEPAMMQVLVDDRSIPTGVLVPDDSLKSLAPIGERNFNTCWKFVGPGEQATALLKNPQTGLSVAYWQDRGIGQYEYIQLYTPPHRESLAIEPMTCPPDVLNNHQGEIVLAPQQSHSLRFGAKMHLP